MALKALILAALLALVSSGTVGKKEPSTAILDKLIAGLRAEGKLQGRQEEALTALREEFPDLITSVRNDNNASDLTLYTKIAEFLKQQGNVPVGGYSTGGPQPGSNGEETYVPPSGGGGPYVPPSGGGGSYVPPSGGGGPYVPPSGGGYVQPTDGEGGYVQPTGGEGGYVKPSGYGQQGGNYPENIRAEIFSIMDTIFAIMKYQGLIYDTDNPVWTLIDRGFDLLADFVRRNIKRNKHEGDCPYSYDVSGDSCLSVDLNALGLSWYESRLYCQVVKGGDLAIFKDANQLRDMQRYLRSFDSKYRYSYYIGASDVKKENYWEFINGEPVPLGTPYWGRTDYDGSQNPSGGEGSDYAILFGKDFFYLADVGYEDTYDLKVVPLCQYFPGRGLHNHDGYHSENGLYHDKGENLGHKLTNILALSSSVYDPYSIDDNTNYKKPRPNYNN